MRRTAFFGPWSFIAIPRLFLTKILPTTYSPGSQASQTSSTARAGSAPGGVMGDMKRNLFGESGAGAFIQVSEVIASEGVP